LPGIESMIERDPLLELKAENARLIALLEANGIQWRAPPEPVPPASTPEPQWITFRLLLTEVGFPTATPRVMRAERTFWEKVTAIHVFCAQGEFRGGDRFARHWHDVAKLDAAGFADAAIADNALARAVAKHKSVFFAEKNTNGDVIDYHVAVTGGLQLVPDDNALAKLAADYQRMVDDGLFLDDAEPFDALLERCRAIQQKANAKQSPQ